MQETHETSVIHEVTHSRNGLKTRRQLLPYVLVSPLILFIGILAFYPTLRTFVQSFFLIDTLDPVKFVGLQNYIDTLRNPAVVFSWGNTFMYMIVGTILSTLIALVVAINLKDSFKGRAIILGILVLPWALPAVTEGIIWMWMYDPSFGVLNSTLKSLHLINHYHVWLGKNRFTTIFMIELVQVWQITPLSTILIMAGLQSIPNELYDATYVDGAGWWRSTFSITLPLIRPSIAVAMVQSIILSINIFDQVWVLNFNATTGASIMLQTYNTSFVNLNFGQGYALSFGATMVTMLISLGVIRAVYRKVEF